PTYDVGDVAALSGIDRAVAGGSVFADVSGTMADRGKSVLVHACSLQESQLVAKPASTFAERALWSRR
ncbi:MAG: hypothetical protein QOJ58_3699, partial [Alphaproteobacteria bacterium]|nr:hypothetical protein [Alphaproteobacteria bacterium]